MRSDQAFQLIEVWAQSVGHSVALRTLNVQPSGDFDLVVGSAGFRYSQQSGELFVSGIVAAGQLDLDDTPAGAQTWRFLISVAALQKSTLGEGYLDLYTGPHNPLKEKPAVYLTRVYLEPPASSSLFVTQVKWIARWATYWRDERYGEIFSGRSLEKLKVEAAEAEAWALKKHPRPW